MCWAHYMRWLSKGDPGSADIVRRQRGKICSVEGCDRPHQGRGFCEGHLRRFLKHGDPGPATFARRQPGAVCIVDGCDKPADGGRGWCNAHYLRWRKYGDPVAPMPTVHPNWSGDAASYNAVHQRLRSQRGRASTHSCALCGQQADHWSYDHGDPAQRVDALGRAYSTDLSHYRPLCATCHRRHDVGRFDRPTCSAADCDRAIKARGMCGRHYQRWRAERG